MSSGGSGDEVKPRTCIGCGYVCEADCIDTDGRPYKGCGRGCRLLTLAEIGAKATVPEACPNEAKSPRPKYAPDSLYAMALRWLDGEWRSPTPDRVESLTKLLAEVNSMGCADALAISHEQRTQEASSECPHARCSTFTGADGPLRYCLEWVERSIAFWAEPGRLTDGERTIATGTLRSLLRELRDGDHRVNASDAPAPRAIGRARDVDYPTSVDEDARGKQLHGRLCTEKARLGPWWNRCSRPATHLHQVKVVFLDIDGVLNSHEFFQRTKEDRDGFYDPGDMGTWRAMLDDACCPPLQSTRRS